MTGWDVVRSVSLLFVFLGGWFAGAGFGYSLAVQRCLSAAGCAQ